MSFDAGLTRSNLDCFLHCTTPTSEIMTLNLLGNHREKENVEYFTLSDLWNCYGEWSAYGAGVPIMLKNYKTLVQYYVLYLSAVQIFTGGSPVNILSDSSSDESDTDNLWRWDGCSSEDGGSEQDSRLGYLYFQYFERSTPYGRVTLTDKIPRVTVTVASRFRRSGWPSTRCRGRVGLGRFQTRPREAGVAFECGGFVAKATWGPAP
ncbi:(RS)-norcoclaurine 6-O-methyltransferase-like isoform 1 [Hibiscus syriacus]|uniref:(RS)-norcoclaurine 6-O-methyltransferase-like isoform 1 n=1 Tax=Hibiscus syriacus TaxID=106335 RepID=A0A6A2WT53_HIBSY|nr:(RS)-norcoclaurine 6-O-methyltransferase-like isoform 1 [Hibiscus syriacus]